MKEISLLYLTSSNLDKISDPSKTYVPAHKSVDYNIMYNILGETASKLENYKKAYGSETPENELNTFKLALIDNLKKLSLSNLNIREFYSYNTFGWFKTSEFQNSIGIFEDELNRIIPSNNHGTVLTNFQIKLSDAYKELDLRTHPENLKKMHDELKEAIEAVASYKVALNQTPSPDNLIDLRDSLTKELKDAQSKAEEITQNLMSGSNYHKLTSSLYDAPSVFFMDVEESISSDSVHLNHVETLESKLKDLQQHTEARLEGMDLPNLSGQCSDEIIAELS